jgi:hypothetical protein
MQEFYVYFSESRPSLLLDVIFPLIATTRSEADLMFSEPD